MAAELLERIADGRTDLAWEQVARGGPATATVGGQSLVAWCGETPLSWWSGYARPDANLRRLCYGTYRIQPDRKPMAVYLQGWPHGPGSPEGGGR